MDFGILKQQIENAAKKAFLEMYEKHGAEKIYSFALYSDEGAMTVCPATNTIKVLETVDQEDALYYKYEPAEWTYEMEGANDEFDTICTQLRSELEKYEEDDQGFQNFQTKLYSSCIEVLEKLKNERFFTSITGEDIFLIFTISEYEFEIEEVKELIIRLNDNQYQREYLEWMATWGN
ncbi:DUF4303 domain-containing protein [Chryseobacterium sp. JK1]|uniref:DUF4303 domain-containing protein n=1 Tax=Chryseobacterium sp. JK1 TaxID=874294 RepID=UPI003D69B088